MKKKHTSQFWVGKFDSSERFYNFVGEDPEYWSEENEGRNDFPLSKFIASQNQTWFDHDFIEAGFNQAETGVREKFKAYSYIEQWADRVEEKAKLLGMEDLNAFIMMGIDESPKQERHLQVSTPCSYKAEGIKLVYLGEFSYIHDYSWMKS
ncbi:immunity 22 family protein [Aliikangiella marina]|uniref:immunity 22 family protein n=1 Tax=Aliikangiella marina TaxID=1712262 RepID=UPI00163D8C7D|nr:immunity 22 family protein [Aliikangiella marina]